MVKFLFSFLFVSCVTVAGFAQQGFKITGHLGGTLGGGAGVGGKWREWIG